MPSQFESIQKQAWTTTETPNEINHSGHWRWVGEQVQEKAQQESQKGERNHTGGSFGPKIPATQQAWQEEGPPHNPGWDERQEHVNDGGHWRCIWEQFC
jgi:hypothetical protein